MATQLRGIQLKDDTLSGIQLDDAVGVWDAEDTYALNARVMWGAKFWTANAATSAGEEPDVSAKWDEVLASGDVSGPVSSTDNALAIFDGTTGKIIQNQADWIISGGTLLGTPATGDLRVTSGVSATATLRITNSSTSGKAACFRACAQTFGFPIVEIDGNLCSVNGVGLAICSVCNTGITINDAATAILASSGNICLISGCFSGNGDGISSLGSLDLHSNVDLTGLATGCVLCYNGTNFVPATVSGGSGDVCGPGSSTDNAIPTFDSATGKIIQDNHSGAVTITDAGLLTAPNLCSTGVFRAGSSTHAGSHQFLGCSSLNVLIDSYGSCTVGLNINGAGANAIYACTNDTVDSTILATVINAQTDQVRYPLRIQTESTGTPAAGIGTGIRFVAETGVSNFEEVGLIEAVTTDVASTSECSRLKMFTMVSGSTSERFSLSHGSLSLVDGTGIAQIGGDGANNIGFSGSSIQARDGSGSPNALVINPSGGLTCIGAGGLCTTSCFFGNGSGITDINGSNITTGTIADARLEATINRTNFVASGILCSTASTLPIRIESTNAQCIIKRCSGAARAYVEFTPGGGLYLNATNNGGQLRFCQGTPWATGGTDIGVNNTQCRVTCNPSSCRYKTDIGAGLVAAICIDCIYSLCAKSWKYCAPTEDIDKCYHYFIAEDIEAHIPEIVRYNQIGQVQDVDTRGLIAVMVETIKNQKACIDSMDARITALETA